MTERPAWRGRRERKRRLVERRRRRRRITAGAVALGVVAGSFAVSLRAPAPPARASSTPGRATTTEEDVSAAHGASFVPRAPGRRPLFILALGSDARPGQVVARQRADAIQLIGIDRTRTRATVLGFPRDSWVRIPGVGRSKINNALRFGGPELAVRTVQDLTGIRADYWVLTSFEGLQRMVDGIGGISVNVPYRMADRYSGAFLREGVQRLRGWQALAFARNRKDTPRGDFSRSENQGRLLLAALGQLRREFGSDPARMLRWMVTGWRNVQTNLSFPSLLDLAMTATQISPQRVNNVVVPGSSGSAGAASVVYLSPRAAGLFADMRADGVVG